MKPTCALNHALRNSGIKSVIMALLCSPFGPLAHAQDIVPGEIWGRTFMIKAGNSLGTAFSIDYQGTIYLITAKHVVAGLPNDSPVIQIRHADKWADIKIVKTLFPASADVDIAIFETTQAVPRPFTVKSTNLSSVMMGQQVWFLGFPYGLGSHFQNDKGAIVPFVKKGTISAIDATDPNAAVLYIDGFNNPGFSGGPIIYWDYQNRVYGILGVVKGYREDSAKVLLNGEHVDTQLLVNSGIMVGYGIEYAIDAIKSSQPK